MSRAKDAPTLKQEVDSDGKEGKPVLRSSLLGFKAFFPTAFWIYPHADQWWWWWWWWCGFDGGCRNGDNSDGGSGRGVIQVVVLVVVVVVEMAVMVVLE